MRIYHKWTDDEEKVIISKIKENPNNLSQAFKEASIELDRSIATIRQHWYIGTPKRPALKSRCGCCFMTYGGKSLNINRKNVSINTSNNTITLSIDKLYKIIELLLGNN